jgi:DNA primase
MSSPVQKIKEKLDITEVIGQYVKIEKAGSNYKARCPFHNEKTPSFFISPERNSYYCFGCHAKGDIFTFIQEFEGLDFYGALKVLSEKAGIPLVRENLKAVGERERQYEILEDACLFFERNLSEMQSALTYLKDRGVSPRTIKEFRLGFAKDEWQGLYSHLLLKSWKVEDMEKAGLVKRHEDSSRIYDRFRGRIMFPLLDSSGRVIAFSGRILKDDGKSAKYINSPETTVFSKRDVLYGLYQAKSFIRKLNFCILVEGQMDLIMSHQSGFRNTVAVSGTALAESTVQSGERDATELRINSLGLVKRLSSNLVIAFDSDRAGQEAAKKSATTGLDLGMDVKIADLPEGKDPADVIKEGTMAWKKAIKDSKHIIDFLLSTVSFEDKESRKFTKELKEKVLPYVASVDNDMERDYFISKIADVSRLSKESVTEEIKKILNKRSSTGEVPARKIQAEDVPGSMHSLKHSPAKRLMGVMFWQDGIKNGKKIDVSKWQERIKETLGDDVYDDLERIPDQERNDLAFEAEVYYQESEPLDAVMEDLLNAALKEDLKNAFSNAMYNLKRSELERDTEAVNKYLKLCQELSERIEELVEKKS